MCLWWVPAGHLPGHPRGRGAARPASREHGPTPRVLHLQAGLPRARLGRRPRSCRLRLRRRPRRLRADHRRGHGRAHHRGRRSDHARGRDARLRRDWWPDSMRKIEEKLGRPLPSDFTETYRSRQDAALSEGVEPVAGVIDVVDAVEAAGLRTCVASNGPHPKMGSRWAPRACASASRAASSARPTSSAESPRPTCSSTSPRRWASRPRPASVVEDSALGVRGGASGGMPAYGYTDNAPREAARGRGRPRRSIPWPSCPGCSASSPD